MKPNICVEIGSARGKSACYMGMALKQNKSGHLYAIDPHTKTKWNDRESVDSFEIMHRHLAQLGLEKVVTIVRDTSESVARNWTQPIDLLFIDGDHSYEGVKRDWDLFTPHVKPFGLVLFHDTTWELTTSRTDIGVSRLLEELRTQGFPVTTIEKDHGVSLVQPVKHGIPLHKPAASESPD